ncbi:hypothetical protein ACTXJE_11405 [Glutamicibacter ardleyensis]
MRVHERAVLSSQNNSGTISLADGSAGYKVRLNETTTHRTALKKIYSDDTFIEFVLARSEDSWPVENLLSYAESLLPGWNTTNEQTASIEDIAHHESGHALVAYLSGMTVLDVTIKRKGLINGHCIHSRALNGKSYIDTQWDTLRISLAGNAVDHLRGIFDANSSADMHSAHASMLALISTGISPSGYHGALSFDSMLGCARQEVQELAEKHMAVISELAVALLECQSLNGRAVRGFFESKLGIRQGDPAP